MREIKKAGSVLARLIAEDDFRSGLNFFSANEDCIQVGLWNGYEKDKTLSAHIHNAVERTASRTHEVLYVIKGCIEANIYDLSAVHVEDLEVHQGEILELLECGHGYLVKEDGTVVLEVKNGPYLGATIDRRRI